MSESNREPDLQRTMTFATPGGASKAQESAPRIPTTIARYRVVRLIGEGGMGAVYEAEQDHPRRTVALKVIKAGMASPSLLRRFEQEAEALGRLQHPGIAQIYEAGTADTGFGPQPYFAMEFIRGSALRDYVEDNHLNTPQRLEIMEKVCDAVHHAHQRGLIHRDLKPGNILVDESGQPKILDFGVARVTDRDSQATSQTDVGQLIGTLAYMSPEQVLADPLELDTRSDVYALGVILYELLAKRLPYDIGNKLHEALHAIREEDPVRLSSVSRIYKGDIETIVAKALEKDKTRRYGSAAELGADIRRYLADEPIVARPPSASYQLQKFARRHKAFVAGAAAVFVVLVAGIVASTRQASRANQERDHATSAEQRANQARDQALKAEQQATEDRNKAILAEAQARMDRDKAVAEKQRADTEAAASKAVNDFLGKDLLGMANPMAQGQIGLAGQPQAGAPGAIPNANLTVKEALDRAAVKVQGKFGKQPLVEAAIHESMAQTYFGLGVNAEAQKQLESAVALRTRAQGKGHPDTLTSRLNLASFLVGQQHYREAEAMLRATVDDARRGPGEEHAITKGAIQLLVVTYRGDRQFSQAEEYLKNEVIAYDRRVLGDDNRTTFESIDRLKTLYEQWQPQPRYADAETFLNGLLEEQKRKLGAQNRATLGAISLLADLDLDQRNFRKVIDRLAPIVTKELIAKAAADGQCGLETYFYLPDMEFALAQAYAQSGKPEQAEALQKDFLRFADLELAKETGKNDLDTPLVNMAVLLAIDVQSGQDNAAAELIPRILEAYRRVAPNRDAAGAGALSVLWNAAQLYASKQHQAESQKLLRGLLEIQRAALGDEDAMTLNTATVLATEYAASPPVGESFENVENLVTHFWELEKQKLGEDHALTRRMLFSLADIYRLHGHAQQAQGRRDEAQRSYARAEELRRQLAKILSSQPSDGVRNGGSEAGINMVRIAAVLALEGKYAEAEEQFSAAVEALRSVPGMEANLRLNGAALGWTRIQQDKFGPAEAILREICPGLADPRNPESESYRRYNCEAELAASLVGQKRFAEAEPILLRAYDGIRRFKPAGTEQDAGFSAADAGAWIVRMYKDWGQPEKVVEWEKKVGTEIASK